MSWTPPTRTSISRCSGCRPASPRVLGQAEVRRARSATRWSDVVQFDPVTGSFVRCFEPPPQRLFCVHATRDGRHVIAGGSTCIFIWDANTGALQRTVRAARSAPDEDDGTYALASDPSSRFLAAAGSVSGVNYFCRPANLIVADQAAGFRLTTACFCWLSSFEYTFRSPRSGGRTACAAPRT